MRCAALGAACLHGVLRLMRCAVRKQNPVANGSLIERAHIFPDANGRILPNKAKRRGISPRRDVALVLAERAIRDDPSFFDVLHTEH